MRRTSSFRTKVVKTLVFAYGSFAAAFGIVQLYFAFIWTGREYDDKAMHYELDRRPGTHVMTIQPFPEVPRICGHLVKREDRDAFLVPTDRQRVLLGLSVEGVDGEVEPLEDFCLFAVYEPIYKPFQVRYTAVEGVRELLEGSVLLIEPQGWYVGRKSKERLIAKMLYEGALLAGVVLVTPFVIGHLWVAARRASTGAGSVEGRSR